MLPAGGHSHVHVPGVNCTISDLSGAFWEALLFDTPAVLAAKPEATDWRADLKPSLDELTAVVPVVSPDNLVAAVQNLIRERSPQQKELAEARLGRIDGTATAGLVARIRKLLKEPAGKAAPPETGHSGTS